MTLNQQADYVHQANIKWWQNPKTGKAIKRNAKELLALAVSEICEAMEGERKDLMDDKLPHRRMAEVEMADAKIRLLDYAGGFKIRLKEKAPALDVKKNKGEALLYIMRAIVHIGSASREYQDDQIALAISLIESYCDYHDYDICQAMEEKLEYNSKRKDHTHAERLKKNGKKF